MSGVQLGRRYESIMRFYEERGGAHSGESDFGVFWTNPDTRFPRFRVSVVHNTGDVYALDLSRPMGSVELLGTLEHVKVCADLPNRAHDTELCAYKIAERVLEGWTDRINEIGSLTWVRGRLAEVET
jgi:hypothetical protein